jgi:hypothetical protein
MSYGVDLPDLFRQAATYADRILKGHKPADLPVQLPSVKLGGPKLSQARKVAVERNVANADQRLEGIGIATRELMGRAWGQSAFSICPRAASPLPIRPRKRKSTLDLSAPLVPVAPLPAHLLVISAKIRYQRLFGFELRRCVRTALYNFVGQRSNFHGYYLRAWHRTLSAIRRFAL